MAETPEVLAKRAYDKAYYAARKEIRRAQMRAYDAANREAVRIRRQTSYVENRDVITARQKVYRVANRAGLSAKQLAWREANPDAVLAQRIAYRRTEAGRLVHIASGGKRRARKRGTSVGKIDWTQVWSTFDGTCGVCKQPLQRDTDAYHIDHIVALASGGAHVTANLQVTHAVCNLRKGKN